MGRKRKKPQIQGKRKDRVNYEEIVKENKKYEDYYKEQNCFDLSRFDDFMATIKLPLPAVFRISGYKKHSKQLLRNMKKYHFAEMNNLEIDDEPVKPPSSLPWYPQELAWRTYLQRTQLRRVPQLQKFHAFLIAENESGHITRQEAVSMIPPLLLDVKPHHKVLDMCAAPGSKTAQLIELIHQEDKHAIPEGLCIANDKDNRRCYMLVHQMNRLSSPSTIIVNHDAATFPELYIKDKEGASQCLRYDRVLCDVPCSGDGTMRKNYDVWVKWDICNALYLHGVQLRILMRGLELLATGGSLVYSTCSLNPIEDEAVVAAAIAKCGGAVELVEADLPGLKWSPGVSAWKVMDRSQTWYEKHSDLPQESNISNTMFPPENIEEMRMERCLRLLPHLQDTGGFFVAVLRKRSPLPWQKSDLAKESLNESEENTESAKPPPRKKSRWMRGFKEDPFVFFTETDIKNTFTPMKDFYGLDNFPAQQLLTRTHQEKKKHVYFVSEIAKNVVENNINFLKVINTGVRAFSRADNSQHNLKCAFRLVQTGVECVEPFMTRQRVDISLDDVIKLLVDEQPLYTDLSQDLRDQLKGIDPGSIVYRYFPPNESAEVSCDLLMCGWKGYTATRVYLCKNERMHYLNLCAHPVPDRLMPNNSRRGRATDEANGATDNKNSAVEDEGLSADGDLEVNDVIMSEKAELEPALNERKETTDSISENKSVTTCDTTVTEIVDCDKESDKVYPTSNENNDPININEVKKESSQCATLPQENMEVSIEEQKSNSASTV